MPKHVFTTLDALRGAAALLVVIYHAGTSRIPGGYLAVDMFFALSGFVLAYNYSGAISGLRDVVPFMRKRFVRLYPLYAVALAVGFVVYLWTSLAAGTFWPTKAVATLAANGLFLPAPPQLSVTWHLFPFNPPAWSLLFEMLVNLAFVLALPFLGRRMLWAIIAIGAVMLVASALALGELDGGVRNTTWWAGAARVTFSFFLGVALYRFWTAGRLTLTLNPWVAALALVGLLMVPAPDGWRVARDLTLVLVVLPMLIAASTGDAKSSFLSYLGRISYALYVIHTPILYALNHLSDALVGAPVKELGWFGPALLLAASVPAAALLDQMDAPLRRLLDRILPFGRSPSDRNLAQREVPEPIGQHIS